MLTFCHQCGHNLPLGVEKFCPGCGFNLNEYEDNRNKDSSIQISNKSGNIIGGVVSGKNNKFSQNIGNTVNKSVVKFNPCISQIELDKIPEEYSKALTNFINDLNDKIKGNPVPEEKIKEVKDTITDFVEGVQVTKQEDGEKVGVSNKETIGNKFKKMVKVALKILPAATAIASVVSFGVHLAPFSGLIGESVHNIIENNFNNK